MTFRGIPADPDHQRPIAAGSLSQPGRSFGVRPRLELQQVAEREGAEQGCKNGPPFHTSAADLAVLFPPDKWTAARLVERQEIAQTLPERFAKEGLTSVREAVFVLERL